MALPETRINKSQLLRNGDGTDSADDAVLVAARDRAAPLSMLQSKARWLGAFDPETLIGRFDPDRITQRQMRQMRRDPIINLGLHFKKTMLVNAPWHMECDDQRVAAFAEGALRAIYRRLIPQMCISFAFGYVPLVQRFGREVPSWTYEDKETKELTPVWPDTDIPAITWKVFQALPPDGAEVVFTSDGKSFDGFKHNTLAESETATGPLRVPAEHALWVSRNLDEEFGNWYGYPLTGHAFRYWWSYWYQWLLADRHMENDADPPLRVDYPPGTSVRDGEEVENYVLALEAGTQLRDGATVAIPSDYYESVDTGQLARGARKWDMEFVRGGENIDAFHKSFAYLDVAKLRSILVPEQALIGAKGSLSGNVAETYGVAFAESAAVEMAQLDQHINDHMLPRLLAQNFVNPPRCTKITDGFREEDMVLGIDLLKTVAATDPAGLQIDWRELSRQHKLPLHSTEEIARMKAEAEKAAAAAQPDPIGPNQRGNPANEPRTHIADAGASAANKVPPTSG